MPPEDYIGRHPFVVQQIQMTIEDINGSERLAVALVVALGRAIDIGNGYE